jgi:hypothetical protein
MRIAYHSNGATLTAAALDAWIAATLALSAGAFDALASPGVLIEITDPDYPFAFEDSTHADDRITQGGEPFSRVLYTGRRGDWRWSNVLTAELASWRAWYAATTGFRLPFIVEIGDERYPAVAPGPFPLQLTRLERWGGAASFMGLPP